MPVSLETPGANAVVPPTSREAMQVGRVEATLNTDKWRALVVRKLFHLLYCAVWPKIIGRNSYPVSEGFNHINSQEKNLQPNGLKNLRFGCDKSDHHSGWQRYPMPPPA